MEGGGAEDALNFFLRTSGLVGSLAVAWDSTRGSSSVIFGTSPSGSIRPTRCEVRDVTDHRRADASPHGLARLSIMNAVFRVIEGFEVIVFSGRRPRG